MKKEKKYYCLECDEELKLHKQGTMKDKNGFIGAYIYICEECDQAYGLTKDNKLGLLPYDSKMKPIEESCNRCGKKEKFRQKMVYLVNDMALMKAHCKSCAVKVLREYFKKQGGKNLDKINEDSVQGFADLHHTSEMNKIFSNPDKMKEIKESEPFKAMAKEFGINE